MKNNKFILNTAVITLLLVLSWTISAYAGARTISNTISTNIIVNHVPGDLQFKSFSYSERGIGASSSNFTPANVLGYQTIVDLTGSRANSMRAIKANASTTSSLELKLPEFDKISISKINQNSPSLIDLSSLKPELDREKDGIKLITMERLAAEDGDGDNSVLTIPGLLREIGGNGIGNIEIKVLLPSAAAAWGDNSHIKNAEYNFNDYGMLFIREASEGQEEILKATARSNCFVPHVNFIVAEGDQPDGPILAESGDISIQPGSDVSIQIPIKFKKGSYYLRVYPEAGQ